MLSSPNAETDPSGDTPRNVVFTNGSEGHASTNSVRMHVNETLVRYGHLLPLVAVLVCLIIACPITLQRYLSYTPPTPANNSTVAPEVNTTTMAPSDIPNSTTANANTTLPPLPPTSDSSFSSSSSTKTMSVMTESSSSSPSSRRSFTTETKPSENLQSTE